MQCVNKLSPNPFSGLYRKPFPALLLFFLSLVQHGFSQVHSIVFNEIMCDPVPVIGLPEAEYVELFNRSDSPTDLSGWIFADPVVSASLPPYILFPGGYVILCRASLADHFNAFGSVLALSPMPTLNDAGDVLTLTDNQGVLVDSLTYSRNWYRDSEKTGGGWSLERIDPDDVCGDADNWAAATAPAGGTPGGRNSIYARRPDNFGPEIVAVIPLDSVTLLVHFNEKLASTLPSRNAFSIDGRPGVDHVSFPDALHGSVLLSLSAPLAPGKIHELRADVFDCSGNRIEERRATHTFVLPGKAVTADIVVNEVLFNPRPTGVDFIELFNRSDKVLDIRDWSLRNVLSAGRNFRAITSQTLLIHPQQYLVLTADAATLKNEYATGVERVFVEADIPSLNDDAGCVTLLDRREQVIDSICYSDKMHSPFLRDDEGVSLERISVASPGMEPSNWRSASSASGFATPGYLNSNAREDAFSGMDVVVEPEIVPPRDFARIRYRFGRGGMIANVRIVDHRGRPIRTIAENEMIGTEGFFRWDAEMDNGQPAITGYYMVWFEVFDADGSRATFRKRVVVF